VGADRFGYCLCLKDGQVVHERKPKKYASACAETGTVIGIYIYLPERDVPAEALPTEPRDKFWWKNSGKEYYLVPLPLRALVPCAARHRMTRGVCGFVSRDARRLAPGYSACARSERAIERERERERARERERGGVEMLTGETSRRMKTGTRGARRMLPA